MRFACAEQGWGSCTPAVERGARICRIETGLFRHAERLVAIGHVPWLPRFGIDQLNPGNPDFLVGAGPVA